jgi:protein-S-isoprenylcysteine O-methyltransferase Ste14
VPARNPTAVIVRTGPVPLQPELDLSGVLWVPTRIAICVNSVWLLATLVWAAALIHYVVIRREEQFLERKFGVQYLDYKASVRRCL